MVNCYDCIQHKIKNKYAHLGSILTYCQRVPGDHVVQLYPFSHQQNDLLYTLMEFGVVRFNEMKKYIDGI